MSTKDSSTHSEKPARNNCLQLVPQEETPVLEGACLANSRANDDTSGFPLRIFYKTLEEKEDAALILDVYRKNPDFRSLCTQDMLMIIKANRLQAQRDEHKSRLRLI